VKINRMGLCECCNGDQCIEMTYLLMMDLFAVEPRNNVLLCLVSCFLL
jgi:hypothetical protein